MKLEDNPTSKQNKIKIMQQFNHPYYEKNRKTLCKVCKKKTLPEPKNIKTKAENSTMALVM